MSSAYRYLKYKNYLKDKQNIESTLEDIKKFDK
jgi:hypothetical protein